MWICLFVNSINYSEYDSDYSITRTKKLFQECMNGQYHLLTTCYMLETKLSFNVTTLQD